MALEFVGLECCRVVCREDWMQERFYVREKGKEFWWRLGISFCGDVNGAVGRSLEKLCFGNEMGIKWLYSKQCAPLDLWYPGKSGDHLLCL